MTEDIQVTVISTGFNTLDKNVRPVEKIEKTVPTSDLQNLVNKPLHAQKVDNSTMIISRKNQKNYFSMILKNHQQFMRID